MMPTLTLAIPCYNGGPQLRQVLQAASALRPRPDELLFVDDGSTDGSTDLARECGFQVLSHPQNRGLAAARNTALARARAELVLFLDADAVPRPDLARRITRGFEDPRLAGVGGQVLEPAAGDAAGALPDRWRGHFWRQTQGAEALADAPFLVGACCCLRREAALACGGFDEGYRTNGEDVDLSVRLRRAGHRLAYEPAAQVMHLRRDSVSSLLRMIYRHSRDQVRALRRHGESPAAVVRNAARWGPVTLGSSLRRHRDPALAALCLPCHAASMAGCAAGLLSDET